MTPYFTNALVFLIEVLLGLYTLAVMLRFLLAQARADFRNPVSALLVRVTNPALVPLRRVIPALGRIDLAAIVLLLALKCAEILLVDLLVRPVLPAPLGLVVLAAARLLWMVIAIYFITILIEVVLSWIAPGGYNPALYLIHQLNAPLLGRARRLMPPQGGFDLSPLLVSIVLGLAYMLLVMPLLDLGAALAYR